MRAVSATALAIACAAACVAPGYDIVDSIGDAGESGAGGDGGRSGSSSGGRSGNGGSVSTGGAPNGGDGGEDPGSGGSNTGGASGSGKGGSSTGGEGGTSPTGGGPPTGGTGGTPVGIGGVAGGPPTGGVGGVPPMGGAGGTPVNNGGKGGGPTVSCDATFMVGPDGFVRAPGASCWFGYAYAGGDTGSTVMPTSFATCGAGCMLRTSGMLGPANAANSYAGVAYIAFNVNQVAGAPIMTRIPAGMSLVVTYTKAAGPATIRVQIAGGSSRWCANLTASPATIPYTMFNTMCWEPTNASAMAYAKQPIDAVQLVAPGGETAVALDMTLVSVRDQ